MSLTQVDKNLPPEILEFYRKSSRRLILLDYDGTLVPFALTPEQAQPSRPTLKTLQVLASDQKNSIFIISGRDHLSLDKWFGHLPIGLVAEYGALEKIGLKWRPVGTFDQQWKKIVEPMLEQAAASTPGSVIEKKQTALVFHYRNAANQAGAQTVAKALLKNLLALTEPLKLEVALEDQVVEVLHSSLDKGKAATRILKRAKYDFVLCAGNSASDEAMYKAVRSGAITIRVGSGRSSASYRVSTPADLVKLLAGLT